MKILQMILSKGFRGAERHVAELASAQACDGRVMLVIRADDRDGGLSIRDRLSPAVEVAELRGALWTLQAWSLVRRFRPDVIHAHGGRASRLAARLPVAPPRLATMHLDYRAAWYRGLDALVAPTDWQRAQALALGFPGPVERINLWHEVPPTPPAGRVAALRGDLGAGPGTLVIGAVGSLIPVKGMDLLIAAFRRAVPGDARLVLVGDGPERARLEALAAGDGRIRFLGFRRDVADLYHAMDLFVSAARREPFGLVFLEALGAGCPVLATATAGAREILRDGLLPEEDVEALAAALGHAAAERPGRRSADLSSWRREDSLAALGDLYRRLMAQRPC